MARPDPHGARLRFCDAGGFAPPSPAEIPPRPCQRGLFGLRVGCNRLGCRDCGQLAARDPRGGRYACGCREAWLESVWLHHQPMEVGSPPPVPWEQDAFFDLGHAWQSAIAAKAKRDGPGSPALIEARRLYEAAPDRASRGLRKLLGR